MTAFKLIPFKFLQENPEKTLLEILYWLSYKAILLFIEVLLSMGLGGDLC